MNKYALVTTTIFVPKLLDEYAKDFKKYNRDTIFIVIGDKKTPPETAEYCVELAERQGITVEYFSPERQEEYLSKWPDLRDHIQWNCIMRRNVGILYAYELGCESIATIDDDNFLVAGDYLGTHAIDTEIEVTEITSNTNWMNVCSALQEVENRPFYHRGFPLEMRLEEQRQEVPKTITPAVSAGLWLGDPDIDALTRLYNLTNPIDAVALKDERRLTPAKGTWAPFNSQNTAIARRVIPGYFLSPKVGRYDDIWASYIVKHISDHLDEHIVFGAPLVKQERNPHNYWRDLDMERYGHALSLTFVNTLAEIKLEGKDYKECYAEIAQQLPTLMAKHTLKDDEKTFLEGYFTGMKIWSGVFMKLE